MCISVFANGDDTGEDNHVSVSLHMMAGEYDDNLKWPFHGEVTVQLLNPGPEPPKLEWSG